MSRNRIISRALILCGKNRVLLNDNNKDVAIAEEMADNTILFCSSLHFFTLGKKSITVNRYDPQPINPPFEGAVAYIVPNDLIAVDFNDNDDCHFVVRGSNLWSSVNSPTLPLNYFSSIVSGSVNEDGDIIASRYIPLDPLFVRYVAAELAFEIAVAVGASSHLAKLEKDLFRVRAEVQAICEANRIRRMESSGNTQQMRSYDYT